MTLTERLAERMTDEVMREAWEDAAHGPTAGCDAPADMRQAILTALAPVLAQVEQELIELRERDRVISRHLEDRATGRDPLAQACMVSADAAYDRAVVAERERDYLHAELATAQAERDEAEREDVRLTIRCHQLQVERDLARDIAQRWHMDASDPTTALAVSSDHPYHINIKAQHAADAKEIASWPSK